MAWDTPDVYNQPEKFGLSIVEVTEKPDLSWEYDMVVLFEDEAGNKYWAEDSGCSCPAPFEEYTSIDSLNKGMEGYAEAVERCSKPDW